MNFNLEDIKNLAIEIEANAPPTGDTWLDTRYEEDVPIIGHTNSYYRLAYRIAQLCKPTLTIELGSWRATWAAHVASGNPGGQVITIDIHREDKIAQQKAMETAAHYDNLSYINGWSWDVGVELKRDLIDALGVTIDILFIDAWHEHDKADRERKLYFPMLSDPALVICDDLFDSAGTTEGMLRFWDEMRGEKFVRSGPMHGGIPMGLLKYERENYP